jgi:hypothetical protein
MRKQINPLQYREFCKIWITGTNVTNTMKQLGFKSMKYSQRNLCWTLSENEYIMFILKYGN